jgi:hypothetical protein
MKKNLLALMLMVFAGSIALNAQTTVTNAVFPTAGTELKTKIVNGLQRIDITAAGGNQVWDMSDLVGTQMPYTVPAASTGAGFALFPNTDVILPEIGGVAGEAYIKLDANQMSTIGIIGTIDGFVSNLPVKLTAPRIDLITPMNFGDTSTSTIAFQVALDPHAVPGSALDSTISALEAGAGGLLVIDSIRVTFTTQRGTKVDAWGDLTTPSGNFNVLRLKKTDYTNTVLEVKLTIFGIPNVLWQNPADPNGLNVDPSSLPFVGLDTIITYEFWNDDYQQPILKALTEADGVTPTYGEFYDSGVSTRGTNLKSISVNAFPNPATSYFTLDLKGLEAGDYSVKLYNILGSEVKSTPFRFNGDTKLTVETNGLDAGTYVYRIVNNKNETLATRRIIVVRP